MQTMDAIASEATGVAIDDADDVEIRSILHRQAMAWLQMPGEDFLKFWRAGEFDGRDDPAIGRLISTASLLA